MSFVTTYHFGFIPNHEYDLFTSTKNFLIKINSFGYDIDLWGILHDDIYFKAILWWYLYSLCIYLYDAHVDHCNKTTTFKLM